jgi:peptidoglycan/LPS O-acetylase OafA/YrhL
MLGCYRTFLALLVVIQHLGGASVLGAYAVFGFYCISGYLMTRVVHEGYGYTAKGIGRYLINRFLRIYPLYWMSALLSITIILLFGDSATKSFHPDIFIPQTAADALRNLFIFFPQLESPRLTPPAWALTVELCFYLLIGAGISKSKRITLLWFALSVGYHLYAAINNYAWDDIYFTVWAASLPFSTGAFIYHFRKELTKILGWMPNKIVVGILLFALLPINWWIASQGNYVRDIGFYINYALCAFTIAYLVNVQLLNDGHLKVDKIIGDLSYPIYLFHYQIGFLVMVCLGYIGFSNSRGDMLLAIISMPIILLIAALITRWIEAPIMQLRARIKKQQLVQVTVRNTKINE